MLRISTLLTLSVLALSTSSATADFTSLGAGLASGTSFGPVSVPASYDLSNPYGTSPGASTTQTASTTGATNEPQKQCNFGGAVLVINPAPNSPVTVSANVSNVGNVTVPSGSCN